ncbi:MAG: hypothetical protein AAGB35_00755 [Pseudomonadota bacterium]
MKDKSKLVIRQNSDRRQHSFGDNDFPMSLPSGEVVLHDRRSNPDRRKSGIETEEITVSKDEFKKLFKSFS